ncbi:hypothetical protein [Georgenia faecalis]|uniref:hypothetical protein n=1 Tax=Georgenia faecalis TaxID=2483799 RepID=UPI000FDA9269|nr:hypothetical protein [Georgenia faecalis]
MKRPTILPEQQHDAVVQALYQAADEAGWETLAPKDRSARYTQWVEPTDPIGRLLAPYMTPEAARSWIKDGPMKEYSRANRGAGRYAEFGRHGGTTAADIVRRALGDGATIEPGTSAVKPLRCHAQTTERRHLVIWGEGRSFKELLWAALRAATEEGDAPVIVVLEPPGRIISTDERRRLDAIAKRCSIPVHYMREVLGTRSKAPQQ